MPDEIDLQYAVAAALVGRAIRGKDQPHAAELLGHILEYAGRFPQREMGVMLVSDMHRAIGERYLPGAGVRQLGQGHRRRHAVRVNLRQPMSQEAIETKLAAARTRLILDKPFLGALVLRLPMKPAKPEWCPTTATDARTFYYNPDYIDALSLAQTQFMLAHEALHCALSHFARRQHRIKHRWDLACDFAINPLLLEDGLVPPPNAMCSTTTRA